MKRSQIASLVSLLGCFVAAAPEARSESLNVRVQNDGKPVGDAVVYAVPIDGNGKPVPIPEPVVIDHASRRTRTGRDLLLGHWTVDGPRDLSLHVRDLGAGVVDHDARAGGSGPAR